MFAVTCIGKEDMILGMPWLKAHNLEVDWVSGKVKMSRCPTRCNTCRVEQVAEQRIQRMEARLKERCKTGPLPVLDVEGEMEELMEDNPDDYEQGDRIFATVIRQSKDIKATGNFSQQLVEAHLWKSAPKDHSDAIPPYLRQFSDMFAKESFDSLPE